MKLRMHAMAAAIALIGTSGAWAGEPEAKKWVDSEFQPSTLSKDQQMAEMKWFIEAAAKLKAKGVNEINVVSETITTHEYESKVLAKAFTEITGIKVNHDLIQEGDVVEKLQTSMQSGKSIYDGWISDSDLIGTHYRYGAILPLSDYMAGAGKEWTNPGLDLKDFIGTKFTTAPDGKLYQLPDQQFANVYWFRADWFARQDLKDKFKAKMAMSWACRPTGPPTRTSPTSSPTTSRRSTARRSMATWTTARRTRRWAGASPTRGCRWPAPPTRACPTACRWTSGASAWPTTSARRWAPRWRAAAPPTARPRSMR